MAMPLGSPRLRRGPSCPPILPMLLLLLLLSGGSKVAAVPALTFLAANPNYSLLTAAINLLSPDMVAYLKGPTGGEQEGAYGVSLRTEHTVIEVSVGLDD